MSIATAILTCLTAFGALIWIIRRDTLSFGLPVAYLFGLLLIHVPGAYAHLVANSIVQETEFTRIGITFTAIGAVSFVAGVGISRLRRLTPRRVGTRDKSAFWMFCLIGGWFFTYGLSFLGRIPSVGAAVEQGGAVWMLGVTLGLSAALRRHDGKSAVMWLAALAVYPVLMLLLGGFLSYGSAAMIVVLSGLTVSVRNHARVVVGIVIVAVLGINGFLNYFQHRDDIRAAVWGGAPLEDRIDVTLRAVEEFEWFNPSNDAQIRAFDQRLNQNYFVGLAAARIADGQVAYLYGRSLWEGVLALVPRIWWPTKPVFAGSPRIVSEMTGLALSDTTSFGVGNVMEFQINFGTPGVIGGFLLLGWLLGALDRKAAIAEAEDRLGEIFLFFLPAVALIRPNGSLIEMTGGPASALVAAFGWRWLWGGWSGRSSMQTKQMPTTVSVQRRALSITHPQRLR